MRLALGLLAGLRPEERYVLDRTDVDLQGRTIHVRRAYLSVSPREGGHDLKRPKTELSERVVPMPRALVDILGSFPEPHKGPVLTGAHRGRVSPSTAKRHWTAFLRWCSEEGRDVPRVTIENCRHSYATSYLHAGGQVEDISRILGHSTIVTTYRRYVRPTSAHVADGVDSVIPDLPGLTDD